MDRFRFTQLSLTALLLSSCSVTRLNQPGLARNELQFLPGQLSTEDRKHIPSDDEIISLFHQSMDKSLDGENAFNHNQRLELALFQAGDERFCRLLQSQSKAVIRGNLFHIPFSPIEKYRASCPRLCAMADAYGTEGHYDPRNIQATERIRRRFKSSKYSAFPNYTHTDQIKDAWHRQARVEKLMTKNAPFMLVSVSYQFAFDRTLNRLAVYDSPDAFYVIRITAKPTGAIHSTDFYTLKD